MALWLKRPQSRLRSRRHELSGGREGAFVLPTSRSPSLPSVWALSGLAGPQGGSPMGTLMAWAGSGFRVTPASLDLAPSSGLDSPAVTGTT